MIRDEEGNFRCRHCGEKISEEVAKRYNGLCKKCHSRKENPV